MAEQVSTHGACEELQHVAFLLPQGGDHREDALDEERREDGAALAPGFPLICAFTAPLHAPIRAPFVAPIRAPDIGGHDAKQGRLDHGAALASRSLLDLRRACAHPRPRESASCPWTGPAFPVHGPSRPGWTCEDSTEPGCTCPTCASAPRAQQARLDARGLYRARCTRPPCASAPRAQQARLDMRGRYRFSRPPAGPGWLRPWLRASPMEVPAHHR